MHPEDHARNALGGRPPPLRRVVLPRRSTPDARRVAAEPVEPLRGGRDSGTTARVRRAASPVLYRVRRLLAGGLRDMRFPASALDPGSRCGRPVFFCCSRSACQAASRTKMPKPPSFCCGKRSLLLRSRRDDVPLMPKFYPPSACALQCGKAGRAAPRHLRMVGCSVVRPIAGAGAALPGLVVAAPIVGKPAQSTIAEAERMSAGRASKNERFADHVHRDVRLQVCAVGRADDEVHDATVGLNSRVGEFSAEQICRPADRKARSRRQSR
jgi:hypothetical protein